MFQNFRLAGRTLRRDRGFTLVAILILALGIGANVAVFSVVDAILLRPLPFPHPQQLLWMAPAPSRCGASCEAYSVDAYQEFSARNHAFQSVAGFNAFTSEANLRLTGRGEPQPATGIEVTATFFPTLGVRPTLGRLFQSGEDRAGAAPVALLAYSYWQRQFNGNAAIVGQTIDLNGTPTLVAGVLPASFDFGAVFSPGERVDLFTATNLDDLHDDGNTFFLFGRLRPGLTAVEAQADANRITPGLYFNTKYSESLGYYRRRPMQLQTLRQFVSGKLRGALLLLWCSAGALLLIACVNLANLMLGRAAVRGREAALRLALGASRLRLAGAWLAESLVLGLAGGLAGLGVAFALVAFVSRRGSIALPLLASVRINAVALAWSLGIALAASLLLAILPAFAIWGSRLQDALNVALKSGGPVTGQSTGLRRVRAAMLVSEVALACVLLCTAGLLLRSFLRVLDLNLGFQPTHAAAIQVDYDVHQATAQRDLYFQAIVNRADAIPGVEAAGMVDYLPLERNRAWGPVGVKGKVYARGQLPSPFVYMVTPGYFRAMGMRLRGRDFNWGDNGGAPQVIVLNETAARSLWPQGDAVGAMATINGVDRRVVGVLDDVRAVGVEQAPGWQVYFPMMQEGPDGAELVVRSGPPAAQLTGAVMGVLRALHPDQPAAVLRPIQDVVDRQLSPRRFFLWLVIAFAGFGVLLAALGIYGVISYAVTQRTPEIGIRMALGATPGGVQAGVLAETLRLALAGILAGTVGAVLVGEAMSALLFRVAPADPLTLAAVAALLAAVAALAGYLPARRAARVDPAVALRADA